MSVSTGDNAEKISEVKACCDAMRTQRSRLLEELDAQIASVDEATSDVEYFIHLIESEGVWHAEYSMALEKVPLLKDWRKNLLDDSSQLQNLIEDIDRLETGCGEANAELVREKIAELQKTLDELDSKMENYRSM